VRALLSRSITPASCWRSTSRAKRTITTSSPTKSQRTSLSTAVKCRDISRYPAGGVLVFQVSHTEVLISGGPLGSCKMHCWFLAPNAICTMFLVFVRSMLSEVSP
jgi:hypothetical protein